MREKTSAVFKFNKTSTEKVCRMYFFFEKGKLFLQKFVFCTFCIFFLYEKSQLKKLLQKLNTHDEANTFTPVQTELKEMICLKVKEF